MKSTLDSAALTWAYLFWGNILAAYPSTLLRAEVRARKEAQWNKQNETQLQHWNTPEDGLC